MQHATGSFTAANVEEAIKPKSGNKTQTKPNKAVKMNRIKEQTDRKGKRLQKRQTVSEETGQGRAQWLFHINKTLYRCVRVIFNAAL